MLRQPLSPKKFALAFGGTLLLAILIGLGFQVQQTRNADGREVTMERQRDREMGIPDTGLSESASPEEREQARNRAQEDKMTQERTANPTGNP